MYKITKAELMAKSDVATVAPEHEDNFLAHLVAINQVRIFYGRPMVVSSYYRSHDRQIAIYKNKAKKREFPFADGKFDMARVPMGSCHLLAAATDFADPDGELCRWCMANKHILQQLGLYMENPKKTPGWCHLQSIAPKSGNTVFEP